MTSGRYHPPNRRKIHKKKRQMQSTLFFVSVIKILLDSFYNNYRNFISFGVCHVTIIGWVVYKKSTIFKLFGVYLSEFLIFLHEIFFGSKILPSLCDKHQNFDYRCSRYPGNETLSPEFGHF